MTRSSKRVIYGSIGVIATLIAIVGVWLPGVPTTFPLLVALWALGKSSARLERWLENLPILRHAMIEARRFEREKSVSIKAKVISQACAWVSTIAVAIFVQNLAITLAAGSLAITCSLFMAYIPTTRTSVATEHNTAAD